MTARTCVGRCVGWCARTSPASFGRAKAASRRRSVRNRCSRKSPSRSSARCGRAARRCVSPRSRSSSRPWVRTPRCARPRRRRSSSWSRSSGRGRARFAQRVPAASTKRRFSCRQRLRNECTPSTPLCGSTSSPDIPRVVLIELIGMAACFIAYWRMRQGRMVGDNLGKGLTGSLGVLSDSVLIGIVRPASSNSPRCTCCFRRPSGTKDESPRRGRVIGDRCDSFRMVHPPLPGQGSRRRLRHVLVPDYCRAHP